MRVRSSRASLLGIPICCNSRRTLQERGEWRGACPRGRAIVYFRGGAYIAKVLNASAHGLLVYIGRNPRIGERMQVVSAPHGQAEAVVRWAGSGRAGLEILFDR